MAPAALVVQRHSQLQPPVRERCWSNGWAFVVVLLWQLRIHTLDAVRSCRDTAVRVVGGFATRFIDQTLALGGGAPEDNPPETLVLNPEHMKVAYDMLLREAGVEVLLHALVIDTKVTEGRVAGLELALLDGRSMVECDVAIDCTGDAAIVYQAEAEWQMDRALQPMTYHFRLGNVRPGRNWKWFEDACREAVEKHASEGFVYGGPWIIRLNENEISLNTTRFLAILLIRANEAMQRCRRARTCCV